MGCFSPAEVSNLLMGEYNKIRKPLENILPDFTSSFSEIENNINNMIKTPGNILNQKVNEIISASNGWISNYASDECYQSVVSWIEACDFFSDNPFLRDPLRFLQTMQNNLGNYILNKVREIGSALPEINIASQIYDIWYRMRSSQTRVLDAFEKLLDITDCFANLGEEIMEIIVAIENLMDSFFLTVDNIGNIILNIDKLFLNAIEGIKETIINIFNVIADIFNNALQKINEGIEFFRNKMAQLQKIRDIIQI